MIKHINRYIYLNLRNTKTSINKNTYCFHSLSTKITITMIIHPKYKISINNEI